MPHAAQSDTSNWGFGSQHTKQHPQQQKVRDKDERRQELACTSWPGLKSSCLGNQQSSDPMLPEGGHGEGNDVAGALREQAFKVEAKTEGVPRARTVCVISSCASARYADQARNRLACSITTPCLAQERSAGCQSQHTARAPLTWMQHSQSSNRRSRTKAGVQPTVACCLLKRRHGCFVVQQLRRTASAKNTPQRGQVCSTPPKKPCGQCTPQTPTNTL